MRRNIELSNIVNQMSKTNETLTDESSKVNKQIADLRNICKYQTTYIADQHAFESNFC